MQKEHDKIIEIISEAVALLESGRTPSEIFDLFPEHRNELQETFRIIGDLRNAAEKIKPSKELLVKILAALPETDNVTNPQFNRYFSKDEEKGRLKHLIQIYDFMATKWKVWGLVGVVVVAILVVLGYSQLAPQPAPYADEEAPSVVSEADLPPADLPPIVSVAPATGNIDDAVNAILSEILDTQSAFAAEEKDGTLLILDSQAIGDFGQAYNENEF